MVEEEEEGKEGEGEEGNWSRSAPSQPEDEGRTGSSYLVASPATSITTSPLPVILLWILPCLALS